VSAPAASRRRTAVLISGRGSNKTALVEAARAADFPAEIVLVLANRPDAGGLAYAQAAGIPTASVDHKVFPDRMRFEQAIDAELQAAEVDLVCLAGFMRVLTPWFIARWEGRLLNIHPSLLPLYRGLHTHERALQDGVRLHGCSVHFVVQELDAGPLVAQAAVAVAPGDTADGLAERVLAAEHRLYPAALALVASGRARLEQGRVVLEAAAPPGFFMSLLPA
jgi:phosphoribosylglycinamide formyltransferase-1